MLTFTLSIYLSIQIYRVVLWTSKWIRIKKKSTALSCYPIGFQTTFNVKMYEFKSFKTLPKKRGPFPGDEWPRARARADETIFLQKKNTKSSRVTRETFVPSIFSFLSLLSRHGTGRRHNKIYISLARPVLVYIFFFVETKIGRLLFFVFIGIAPNRVPSVLSLRMVYGNIMQSPQL